MCPAPECGGSRYAREAWDICYENKRGKRYSLPQMMEMDVTTALQATEDWKVVHQRLEVLKNLGLGYLTLGRRDTKPLRRGGSAVEACQRNGKRTVGFCIVFDEPTIGLHPLDVQTLLQVFQALIDNGATVLVIEHDLDVIRNADYIIDMGPGGGEDGGRVVAVGAPEQIAANADSITGKISVIKDNDVCASVHRCSSLCLMRGSLLCNFHYNFPSLIFDIRIVTMIH